MTTAPEHARLVDEIERTQHEVERAERMYQEYGGLGNQSLLLAAQRKRERALVALRQFKGRP